MIKRYIQIHATLLYFTLLHDTKANKANPTSIQEHSESADLRQGESCVDPESVSHVRTSDLGDFRNLTGTS